MVGVLRISSNDAQRLRRAHGQNAIVVAGRVAVARLVTMDKVVSGT